jgi:hypothetical protein
MKEPPKWYLLVEYWCQIRKPRGYGLTIPFVIGSIGSIDIKELLLDISNIKCPEYIILRYCPYLEEYVLSFDKWLSSCSDRLKSFDNLIIYDENDIIEKMNSIDELADFFNERYSKYISESKFSLNTNHEWIEYTEEDNWRLKLF